MPFHFDEGEIEDAEFVEIQPEPVPVPQVSARVPTNWAHGIEDMRIGSMTPDAALAVYEKRARAISIFVRIPFFTFVAFHDKTPAPIRLGAGLLALWEALQLARNAGEVEDIYTAWAEQ